MSSRKWRCGLWPLEILPFPSMASVPVFLHFFLKECFSGTILFVVFFCLFNCMTTLYYSSAAGIRATLSPFNWVCTARGRKITFSLSHVVTRSTSFRQSGWTQNKNAENWPVGQSGSKIEGMCTEAKNRGRVMKCMSKRIFWFVFLFVFWLLTVVSHCFFFSCRC